MVFRSIHGESLSLCKYRRARIKGPAGRIWPVGCSLPMSGIDGRTYCVCLSFQRYTALDEKHVNVILHLSKVLLVQLVEATVYFSTSVSRLVSRLLNYRWAALPLPKHLK